MVLNIFSEVRMLSEESRFFELLMINKEFYVLKHN